MEAILLGKKRISVYNTSDHYPFTYNGVKYETLSHAMVKNSEIDYVEIANIQVKQHPYLQYLMSRYAYHGDPHFYFLLCETRESLVKLPTGEENKGRKPIVVNTYIYKPIPL